MMETVAKIKTRSIIHSFSVDMGDMNVFHSYGSCASDIRDIRLIEKLFTTEDDVDIYEGDAATFVKQDWSFYTITKFPKIKPIKGWKYFSTKEAAEEYIIENKPYLSLNDIMKIGLLMKGSKLYFEYRDLVKSKL